MTRVVLIALGSLLLTGISKKTEVKSFVMSVVGVTLIVVGLKEQYISLLMEKKNLLNGKSEEQFLETHSSELIGNMNLAKQILLCVQKKIPFSPNYPQRSKWIRECKDSRSVFDVVNRKTLILNEIRKKINRMELFQLHGIGNCHEMAALGKAYADVSHVPYLVELVQIKNGDHSFLLIGRNYREVGWGDTAVICDPWIGSFYPAFEVHKWLRNFEKTEWINGKFQTIVTPFNPFRQKLQIIEDELIY